MKKFIQTFLEEQSKLLGKIEKKLVPIASANGITFSDNGISKEEAAVIYSSEKAYKKESRWFGQDGTKSVISKKIFLKFLEEMQGSNLFLFTHLDEKSITGLLMERGDIESIKDAKDEYGGCGLSLLLIIAIVLIGGIAYNRLEEYHPQVAMITSLVFITAFWWPRKSLAVKRSKRLAIIDGDTVFVSGHDYPIKNSNTSNTVDTTMVFTEKTDMSDIVNFALTQGKTMGYLIFKNAPLTIDFDPQYSAPWLENDGSVYLYMKATVTYSGPIIPVIVFDESILFFNKYIDQLSGPNTSFEMYSLKNFFEKKEIKLLA